MVNENLGSIDQRMGSMVSQGLQWEMRLVPNPRLQLIAGWSRMGQASYESTTDSVNTWAAPESDQLNRVEARWLDDRGESSLALFRRQELQGHTGLRLN